MRGRAALTPPVAVSLSSAPAIGPPFPPAMASEVVAPAPVAEPAAAPAASASSAPAPAAAAADPVDTGVVHHDLHVSHPPITPEVQEKLAAFRLTFAQDPVVSGADPAHAADFLTDQNLHRYLRARQFDFVKAKKLLLESFAWRLQYKPSAILCAEVEPECATGKILVLPHLDRHHRPIIVMDSSRENSKTHDSQLRHLVWQLERAKRKMNRAKAAHAAAVAEGHPSPAGAPRPVEKYCLFINMERNSIWNSPPMKTSMETLKTLTERYPEHLGHAIVYKPGLLFAGLWACCKPVMDARTVNKVKFIRGDVNEGSDNDKLLREIIGPDWRSWCDVPKDGYDHKVFWPTVVAEEAQWIAEEDDRKAKQQAQAEAAAAAAAAAAPAAEAPAAAPEAVAAPAVVDAAPAAAAPAEPVAPVEPVAEPVAVASS